MIDRAWARSLSVGAVIMAARRTNAHISVSRGTPPTIYETAMSVAGLIGGPAADITGAGGYFFRVPYGLWFVGLSETPRSLAWDCTALAERPM